MKFAIGLVAGDSDFVFVDSGNRELGVRDVVGGGEGFLPQDAGAFLDGNFEVAAFDFGIGIDEENFTGAGLNAVVLGAGEFLEGGLVKAGWVGAGPARGADGAGGEQTSSGDTGANKPGGSEFHNAIKNLYIGEAG